MKYVTFFWVVTESQIVNSDFQIQFIEIRLWLINLVFTFEHFKVSRTFNFQFETDNSQLKYC